MNKKQYTGIIIGIIIILGFLFYWYEWRPSQAKIDCAVWAMEEVETIERSSTGNSIAEQVAEKYGAKIVGPTTYDPDEYDHVYKTCLQRNGF